MNAYPVLETTEMPHKPRTTPAGLPDSGEEVQRSRDETLETRGPSLRMPGIQQRVIQRYEGTCRGAKAGVLFDSLASPLARANRRAPNLLLIGTGEGNSPFLRALLLQPQLYGTVVALDIPENLPWAWSAANPSWPEEPGCLKGVLAKALQETGAGTIVLCGVHPFGALQHLASHPAVQTCVVAHALAATASECLALSDLRATVQPLATLLFTAGAQFAMDFCSRRPKWVRGARRVHGRLNDVGLPGLGVGPLSRVLELHRRAMGVLIAFLNTAGLPFEVLPPEPGVCDEAEDRSRSMNSMPRESHRTFQFQVRWADGGRIDCRLDLEAGGARSERELKWFGEEGGTLGCIDLTEDGCLPHLRILQALRRPVLDLSWNWSDECGLADVIERCEGGRNAPQALPNPARIRPLSCQSTP